MLIDTHVHIVGDGSGGSGCWLKTPFWHWPLQALMCRHIGLPLSSLRKGLDRVYADLLLRYVQESSLDGVIILAQEQVYHPNGTRASNPGRAYVPNDYVLDLARKYPQFLPAVSIHPARPDALTELERCIERGAVMMKCLPNCQNIDCQDRRYTRFWERMAEAGIPLLAHTGGEHTLPVIRPEFADPRTLIHPLECGVTVIAAHSASKSGIFDPEYFHYFREMLHRFPNFYGDNSAFHIPIRSRIIPATLAPEVQERLIHGSDYPVPIFGHWAWLRGLLPDTEFRRWQKHPNPLERDYQFKRAIGYQASTFTRVSELIPAHGLERLRKAQEAQKSGLSVAGRE